MTAGGGAGGDALGARSSMRVRVSLSRLRASVSGRHEREHDQQNEQYRGARERPEEDRDGEGRPQIAAVAAQPEFLSPAVFSAGAVLLGLGDASFPEFPPDTSAAQGSAHDDVLRSSSRVALADCPAARAKPCRFIKLRRKAFSHQKPPRVPTTLLAMTRCAPVAAVLGSCCTEPRRVSPTLGSGSPIGVRRVPPRGG